MKNRFESIYGDVKVIQRDDYSWGVTDLNGNTIVPFGEFGWIDGFERGLARVRTHGRPLSCDNVVSMFYLDENGEAQYTSNVKHMKEWTEQEYLKNPDAFPKWGIINTKGEEVLKVKYKSVWKFIGTRRVNTRVETIDGSFSDVYFHILNPDLPTPVTHKSRCISDDYDNTDYESDTWYAMTDGQYGDYPEDFDGDYSFMGF